MPLLEHSTFKPFPLLRNKHFQTILPNYFARKETVNYTREIFDTPDNDKIALDWSRVNSDKLVVINHGLCGHSRRHYALALAKAFNQAGWDCLAWNFRGTSEDPFENLTLKLTTNNSTYELDWIIRHAIKKHNYAKVAISGFSMGGNIAMLYLGRHASELPTQLVGAAVFCAVTDLYKSCEKVDKPSNKLYSNHLLKKLSHLILRKQRQFPGQVDPAMLKYVKSFADFDDHYTSPIMGFKDHFDYWNQASAYHYFDKLNLPVLMVAPQDDPFLDGQCVPVETARKSDLITLEVTCSGGHCGFLGPRDNKLHQWWPAFRATQFLAPLLEGTR